MFKKYLSNFQKFQVLIEIMSKTDLNLLISSPINFLVKLQNFKIQTQITSEE